MEQRKRAALTSGYSGTPLAKKLGIRDASRVVVLGAPEGYHQLLQPLPDAVQFDSRISGSTEIVHVFYIRRAELEKALPEFRAKLNPSATLWVSWPKKASKVPTDITGGTVRELALPLGFVDVKVCAVDEVWSALKLVVRKELR